MPESVNDPFDPLETALAWNLPTVQLTQAQVIAILERRNLLLGDKNSVVRENWELVKKLGAKT